MTFYEKMWEIASTANYAVNSSILFESWKGDIMPLIQEKLNEAADKINYDGWTWDRPYSEYGPTTTLLFWLTIRPVVLQYLNDNHPEAWFKPMYMTREEQSALGLPV